ncbi:MAG: tRNA (adenosine(37)-N6)-threonylcarbamoyltransferase complex ATPase subunit type 1 TsaE [bacterium]|jgi:tRNA threonylcarbamoyladenosine biosynthesis protein TsaE|nr:tRNA (adenosine(37)-N6)-threonylcarbamoyltransferase complex ATPase subunit type 1 TsaE [bacterium]
MIRLTAHSTDDTRGIAQAIAKLVRAGDMIVLIGEMGSGKTTFSQHFAHALGVTEPVTSPTFNLLHNYSGSRLKLHHADLYRLERTGELDDLGLTDLQEAGGVMLVEWGDVVGDALGTGLVLKLAAPENADSEDSVTVRQIEIDWRGMQWETRWDKLRTSLDAWTTS